MPVGNDLLRFKKKQKYLIIDTETEGVNLRNSRPWQISYAVATLDKIESINVRYILWDNLNISEAAATLTRFNKNEYLKLAEEPRTVLEDFEKMFLSEEYLLAGHNVLGFDWYIIENWRNRMGKETDWSYINRTLDTNCLSKAYKKGLLPEADLLSWQYKLNNYRDRKLKTKLGIMCKEFQIEYDESKAHRAEYDVEVNHKLLAHLIKNMDI